MFRKLCESPECHAHGKDTGTDAPIVGYLVADDGAAGGIHNKPDIGFDAADLDVGLIGNKSFSFLIRILVNKWFDADGRGLAVVCDLLVGDVDVIEIFESLASFAKGKAKVDVQGETQGHDVGVMFTEFQGRGIPGEGV